MAKREEQREPRSVDLSPEQVQEVENVLAVEPGVGPGGELPEDMVPLSSDPKRMAEFIGGPGTPPESQRAMLDTNAYGQPVIHRY